MRHKLECAFDLLCGIFLIIILGILFPVQVGCDIIEQKKWRKKSVH